MQIIWHLTFFNSRIKFKKTTHDFVKYTGKYTERGRLLKKTLCNRDQMVFDNLKKFVSQEVNHFHIDSPTNEFHLAAKPYSLTPHNSKERPTRICLCFLNIEYFIGVIFTITINTEPKPCVFETIPRMQSESRLLCSTISPSNFNGEGSQGGTPLLLKIAWSQW